MYEVVNPSRVDRWMRESGFRDIIGIPDPKVTAWVYNRGELLVTPLTPLSSLLLIVEGSVSVYTIQEDGRHIPIMVLGKRTLLGDVEFYSGEPSGNYVEAKSRVVCLCLSLSEYGEALHRDVRFLHTLLDSFYMKLSHAVEELTSNSLEERVVAYMSALSPAHEIQSVESTLYPLHCSRRQLQRVLKKLCDSGRIEKLGKGRYRLREPQQ